MNTPSLCISTGVPAAGFTGQQVTAVARRGGLIVYPDHTTKRWPVEEIRVQDGEITLYGPAYAGTPLSEVLKNAPFAQPSWGIPLIAAVLRESSAGDETFVPATTATTIIGTDGGILLLDKHLSDQIRRNLPRDRRRGELEPYEHHRLQGSESALWFALTAIYHGITGVIPEQEENSPSVPPVHQYAPAIPPVVAAGIDQSLQQPETVDRAAGTALLAALHSAGWSDNASAEERDARTTTAENAHAVAVKRSRRGHFWRHNGTRIAIAVMATALVLTIPVAMIRSRLAPPATAGMAPEEVIAAFYSAWSTLDHALMEDALARSVGRDVVREVTNIFVIDRVRTAQEMRQFLVPPEQWYALPPEDERLPYGPGEREITIRHSDAERVEAVITYWLYRQTTSEIGDDEPPRAARIAMRDTMTLEPGPRAWEITVLESSQMGPEELVPR